MCAVKQIEANSFEASSVFGGAIFTEAKFADNSLGIVTNIGQKTMPCVYIQQYSTPTFFF